MLTFSIPVEPRPMPRPRFSKGRTYTPKDVSEYKQKIQSAAIVAMDGAASMTGELRCAMKFYRKFKHTSRRFGDSDNLFKAVADACNGICYLDDAQIVSATIEKHTDKIFPRVEVLITEI